MIHVKISVDFIRESKKLYKKHNSLAKDVISLIDELKINPFMGIPIGKSGYKIRLRISSKHAGKSGGARVITHVHIEVETITLLAIYDKSEHSTISDADIMERLNKIS